MSIHPKDLLEVKQTLKDNIEHLKTAADSVLPPLSASDREFHDKMTSLLKRNEQALKIVSQQGV